MLSLIVRYELLMATQTFYVKICIFQKEKDQVVARQKKTEMHFIAKYLTSSAHFR